MLKYIFQYGFALLLLGCAATSLEPNAHRVQIYKKPLKGCQYLGEVTGSQGNFFTGAYTSNANLETGARNDLKNKAMKLGGNVVVILTERAGQTTSQGGGGSQTNVVITGAVYQCPASVLDQDQ